MRAVPFAVGAALGLAAAESARRAGGRRGVLGAGVGLVGAAAVYPAARRDRRRSPGLAVEAAVTCAASVLTAVAMSRAPVRGRRPVAAGWAAHALFDATQGPSKDSRLPGWYPAVCAGFDLAYAGRLVVPAH